MAEAVTQAIPLSESFKDLRFARRLLEQLIERAIDALDALDSPLDDLEDEGDREPDDTGIADLDALALIELAKATWLVEG